MKVFNYREIERCAYARPRRRRDAVSYITARLMGDPDSGCEWSDRLSPSDERGGGGRQKCIVE